VPKEPEREYIHSKYIGELLKNQFLPETRTEILRIAQRMKAEDVCQSAVEVRLLACEKVLTEGGREPSGERAR